MSTPPNPRRGALIAAIALVMLGLSIWLLCGGAWRHVESILRFVHL